MKACLIVEMGPPTLSVILKCNPKRYWSEMLKIRKCYFGEQKVRGDDSEGHGFKQPHFFFGQFEESSLLTFCSPRKHFLIFEQLRPIVQVSRGKKKISKLFIRKFRQLYTKNQNCVVPIFSKNAN